MMAKNFDCLCRPHNDATPFHVVVRLCMCQMSFIVLTLYQASNNLVGRIRMLSHIVERAWTGMDTTGYKNIMEAVQQDPSIITHATACQHILAFTAQHAWRALHAWMR